jgi:hypothetical protein
MKISFEVAQIKSILSVFGINYKETFWETNTNEGKNAPQFVYSDVYMRRHCLNTALHST